MNKLLLCICVVVLTFGGLYYLKPGLINKVYYIPPTSVQEKALYYDLFTVEQVKSDLIGKSVVIDGQNHIFSDLDSIEILNQNQNVVEVKVCTDVDVVQRLGLLRRARYHENVCGSLRMKYDNKLNCVSIENINLKKTLIYNYVH